MDLLTTALSQWHASAPPAPLGRTARSLRIVELRELIHAAEHRVMELGDTGPGVRLPRSSWETIFALRDNIRSWQREVDIHRMDAIVADHAAAHRASGDDCAGDDIEFLQFTLLG